jgi:hypothetical protein
VTGDREQQIRRAREVLDDAGWLFDDFVNNESGPLTCQWKFFVFR